MPENATPTMMTLTCQHGDTHKWERAPQRGRPPRFCPEHSAPKAAPRPKLSPEEAAQRRVEGKRAKAEARKAEDRTRQQAAAREAAAAIPAAEQAYNAAIEATAKAVSADDVKTAFAKADRAQDTLLNLIRNAKRVEVTA